MASRRKDPEDSRVLKAAGVVSGVLAEELRAIARGEKLEKTIYLDLLRKPLGDIGIRLS